MLLDRKDLNNPPTAVGGIKNDRVGLGNRKDLNNPPTAVGGISDFATPSAQKTIDTQPEPILKLSSLRQQTIF